MSRISFKYWPATFACLVFRFYEIHWTVPFSGQFCCFKNVAISLSIQTHNLEAFSTSLSHTRSFIIWSLKFFCILCLDLRFAIEFVFVLFPDFLSVHHQTGNLGLVLAQEVSLDLLSQCHKFPHHVLTAAMSCLNSCMMWMLNSKKISIY